MGCTNIKFILNNIPGIQNSDKRIKIFEYFKNKFDSNRMAFLQVTHSCKKDEKSGMNILKHNYSFCKEQ